MINAATLYPVLGRSVEESEVKDLFNSSEILLSSELSLPDGEYRAYIERPKHGVSFVFTDEAFFLGQGERPIGEGALYFSGVFLYSEGYEGYEEYKLDLPLGIRFSDSAADASNKLGSFEWERRDTEGVLRARRWLLRDGRRIHLTFDDEKSILIVSYSVPDTAL